MKWPRKPSLFLTCLIVLAMNVSAQTNYQDKIADWKKLFPKQDAVSYTYKETITFLPNFSPKPGEGAVKTSVLNEMILVPLKDYMNFEDGMFYNDEVAIEQLQLINPEGKSAKFEKNCMPYQEESIFHSDAKLCIVRFQMGEKGKAYKMTFQENYRDVKYMTSFYFNRHLPTVERIVEFHIPSWLELDLREFNFAGAGVEKSSVKEGDVTKVTFKYKDAQPYTREPYSPNHAISYPHIISVAKAYNNNGQRHVLFESVKDLYGWYSNVCSDIGNKPEELKAKVGELTFNKKTDLEKIESIFYWVQDNIRYIAFEDGIMGFKPDAAQNVLQKKYGDCKGKANLLKEMLKIAGYDARLTWIGTSDLPYDYTLPSLSVDNHMICTVNLNGKRYFLDGTEDYIAINDYAQRIQGKQVLIEDGKNYIIDKVPQFNADRNKAKKVTKLTIDGDHLAGTSTIEYNGESKINVQRAYSSIKNSDKKEALHAFLKSSDENIQVTNIKNPDFNDRQKPLQVTFDFKASNQITKAGTELYVVMDWDKEFSSSDIPTDRKNDYEFSHKYLVTTQTELAIPEGYKVDYMPAAFKRTTPDYSFEGSYVNKGKSIVYTKTISVSKVILRKAEFPAWNKFISDINEFYNDQIVLKK
jgi:transglutaminase-like putative cysteine protease